MTPHIEKHTVKKWYFQIPFFRCDRLWNGGATPGEWMKCIPNCELRPHNNKNGGCRDCGRKMWSGGLDDLQLSSRSYTCHPLQAAVGPYVSDRRRFVTAGLFLHILRGQKQTLMLFLTVCARCLLIISAIYWKTSILLVYMRTKKDLEKKTNNLKPLPFSVDHLISF